jgi:hypothetical protein
MSYIINLIKLKSVETYKVLQRKWPNPKKLVLSFFSVHVSFLWRNGDYSTSVLVCVLVSDAASDAVLRSSVCFLIEAVPRTASKAGF